MHFRIVKVGANHVHACVKAAVSVVANSAFFLLTGLVFGLSKHNRKDILPPSEIEDTALRPRLNCALDLSPLVEVSWRTTRRLVVPDGSSDRAYRLVLPATSAGVITSVFP